MPERKLTLIQAIAMLVGIVVGVGIYKTPALVAANVPSEAAILGLWLLGGILTFIGALCYAELGAANPDIGGEYHYLVKGYGPAVGFLFAWGRMTVMQSGSIAAVAFVYGEYAAYLVPAGAGGTAIHAAVAIATLSALQLRGAKIGGRTQVVLTSIGVSIVVFLALIGLMAEPRQEPVAPVTGRGAGGLAMVLILLTYGGWSETAYLSGELREPQRNMPRALVIGTAIVTGLYLLLNVALLKVYGVAGLSQASAVVADLIGATFGAWSAAAVAVIVCALALSTLNGTIFTGARSIFALGQDFKPFAALGKASARSGAPARAVLLQAAISLGLVAFAAFALDGFQAMVEYSAPVFWTFILLVGITLFLFRRREPGRELPFRVPLYPLTPLIFCATSVYLLYSSLAYTGLGALIGAAMLAAGAPVYFLGRRRGDLRS